jgi:hypothetical protein
VYSGAHSGYKWFVLIVKIIFSKQVRIKSRLNDSTYLKYEKTELEAFHSDFQPNSTFKMFKNSGTVCTVHCPQPSEGGVASQILGL